MDTINKKRSVWTVLSVVIALFSIWAVMMQSRNFSLTELREFIVNADKVWLFLAGLSMLCYIAFEGCALLKVTHFLGYRRSFLRGTLYSAADVYFSAITPSASGGQPASAFFMMRDQIPGTVVTVALLLNAVMHTMALFVIGFFSFLFRFHLVMEFTLISRLFIAIGAVVLLGLSGIFFLALKRGELLYGICMKVLSLLERLHLLRNSEKRKDKLLKTLGEYKKSSEAITGHPLVLLEVFFWNVCQRVAQFGVSFMVFKAIGYDTFIAARAWIIQSFVSVGSNCVPIPGSMGVADYLMLDGFTRTIGEDAAAYMELICRGISFYGCALTSAVIVLLGYLFVRKQK